MKRSSRVEIITYSRRSVVVNGEAALDPDQATEEEAAIESLLKLRSTLPPSAAGPQLQKLDRQKVPAATTDPKHGPRSFFKWLFR